MQMAQSKRRLPLSLDSLGIEARLGSIGDEEALSRLGEDGTEA
jgi:hypothetical protein